jgi:CRP-like cAMP-binding protein
MPGPTGPPNRPRNRLLAALSAQDYAALWPHLEPVSPAFMESIYEPNQPIPYVYFPESGVFSLLVIMGDGAAVEVATVGNEGMVGLPVFLGVSTTPGRAFAQVPGVSMRMRAYMFNDVLAQNGGLTAILRRYTQAFFVQITQMAACNRLHSIEERCARWLLMTHDQVGSNEFRLTQEFIAQMLGVRRASVTVAAGALQHAGLISYRRGRITIEDREGLEQAACECYGVIRAEYARLFG